MKYRTLGSTGYNVSEIGFGAWAIGADWGSVDDTTAMAALHAAVDNGVNFIDTADVYGDGRSEQFVARLVRERSDVDLVVATKAGRRLDPHTADGYTGANIERFIDRSLTNLRTNTLDLVQLHCPPTDVYYQPELFDALDGLKDKGKIRHYGVSVERVEEAMKAIEYPGVETVQIIYNMFRQRPAERFFDMAKIANVGIIVRVPLASGLLTGRMTPETVFAADDHRAYNRHGEAFDVGETFAGVPFETGLDAVTELSGMKPESTTMAQFALRWILMSDAVSTAIPGAKNPEQAIANAAVSDLPPIDDDIVAGVAGVYERLVKPSVHARW
ncbi:MAG: aldo/keto reductase [Actinomycetota bacterium]|nr:aldo/keto reductase [Actinomycetota bacterium]